MKVARLFILVLSCCVAQSWGSKCSARGGVCQDYTKITCIAGYETRLCPGSSNIRCCKSCSPTCISTENFYKRERDGKCAAKKGECKHESNYCRGTYRSGLCGGSSSRKCCEPNGGTSSGSCTLLTYTATNIKGYQGKTIRIEPSFKNAMDTINLYALACHVTVMVTSSYRKDGNVVPGAIVIPASKSNHKVGHAIDMNLAGSRGYWCNSTCLKALRGTKERCFIDKVRANSGLRWGGDFTTPDSVHIDDGLNLRNSQAWNSLFKSLQPNC